MRSIAEMMDLSGRVAVISGGAGHLGQAMASTLAELGCSLCMLDKHSENLIKTKELLIKNYTCEIETMAVNLESEDERRSVAECVKEKYGRTDILVNNAGFVGDNRLSGWTVPFEQQEIATWRRALEVNLTAAFHLSQLFSPMLKEHGNGSIINIASIYGVAGPDLSLYEDTNMGSPAAYAASKGGLIQLTRWLSTILAPDVRVNCISPGGIARSQPESFVRRYISRTPMRRMGKEEDFKGAIAYFASDLSAWVTGENLMVDGGWTAW